MIFVCSVLCCILNAYRSSVQQKQSASHVCNVKLSISHILKSEKNKEETGEVNFNNSFI